MRREVVEHPTASFDFGKGTTILDKFDEDKFAKERRTNKYFPFTDEDDFEMGAWFIRSSVSMSDIDKFLKLSAVSYRVFQRLKKSDISFFR